MVKEILLHWFCSIGYLVAALSHYYALLLQHTRSIAYVVYPTKFPNLSYHDVMDFNHHIFNWHILKASTAQYPPNYHLLIGVGTAAMCNPP